MRVCESRAQCMRHERCAYMYRCAVGVRVQTAYFCVSVFGSEKKVNIQTLSFFKQSFPLNYQSQIVCQSNRKASYAPSELLFLPTFNIVRLIGDRGTLPKRKRAEELYPSLSLSYFSHMSSRFLFHFSLSSLRLFFYHYNCLKQTNRERQRMCVFNGRRLFGILLILFKRSINREKRKLLRTEELKPIFKCNTCYHSSAMYAFPYHPPQINRRMCTSN